MDGKRRDIRREEDAAGISDICVGLAFQSLAEEWDGKGNEYGQASVWKVEVPGVKFQIPRISDDGTAIIGTVQAKS